MPTLALPLVDPGFETQSFAGWTTVQGTPAFGGGHSGVVSFTSPDTAEISQRIDLRALGLDPSTGTAAVRVKPWLKSLGAPSGPCRTAVKFYGADLSFLGEESWTEAAPLGVWTQRDYSAALPAAAAFVDFHLRLEADSPGYTDVWQVDDVEAVFDDPNLRRIPSPAVVALDAVAWGSAQISVPTPAEDFEDGVIETYNVYADGALHTADAWIPDWQPFELTALSPARKTAITVRGKDSAGNLGWESDPVTAVIPAETFVFGAGQALLPEIPLRPGGDSVRRHQVREHDSDGAAVVYGSGLKTTRTFRRHYRMDKTALNALIFFDASTVAHRRRPFAWTDYEGTARTVRFAAPLRWRRIAYDRYEVEIVLEERT